MGDLQPAFVLGLHNAGDLRVVRKRAAQGRRLTHGRPDVRELFVRTPACGAPAPLALLQVDQFVDLVLGQEVGLLVDGLVELHPEELSEIRVRVGEAFEVFVLDAERVFIDFEVGSPVFENESDMFMRLLGLLVVLFAEQ